MLPTSWPSTSYALLRPASRIYEGFIPLIDLPMITLPQACRLAIAIDPIQPLTVTLTYGTYSELVTFTIERSKQTTQLFPGLAAFTTSILGTSGGLAITAIDPQGRPVHFNEQIETGNGFFSRRAHPVAYSILGQIVQSEAVLLKSRGEEAIMNDYVVIPPQTLSPLGGTYTVVRVNEIRDIANDLYYQIDLKRKGREQ
jgi:hypothetical protein